MIDTAGKLNKIAVKTETAATHGKRSVLPAYKILAQAASVPVIVAVAIALILMKVQIAVGFACGLVIALVMYGGIYSFTNGAANMLVSVVGGKAGVSSGGFMPTFALLSIGKFVLVGLLLFLMVRLLHANLFALAGGFLIAQMAITLACVKSLASEKLVGPNR